MNPPSPTVEKLVRLKAGGRELPLTSLYSPRLDLLGSDGVGRGHHRLTRCFFAPTPRDLKAGDEFLIEDRLWSEARALGSLEAEGRAAGDRYRQLLARQGPALLERVEFARGIYDQLERTAAAERPARQADAAH